MPLKNHAEVERDGFKVPLLGIPPDAILQECELCHSEYPLRDVEMTATGRLLCVKCRSEMPNESSSATGAGREVERTLALAHGSALTVKDILPGRCYEAKHPARIGYPSLYNDRQVKWVSSLRTEVQYDSPTVADGRRFPKVSMEKFLKWAGRDVTDTMPKGEWRAWRECEEWNKRASPLQPPTSRLETDGRASAEAAAAGEARTPNKKLTDSRRE